MESLPFRFEMDVLSPYDKAVLPEDIIKYQKYYQRKYDICKKQNPKTIIEIGVRAGYSALSFLQACPEASFIGIDLETWKDGVHFTNWARELLKDFDFEIWKMNTQHLTSINKENIDFFHIDGAHSTVGVMHDLDLCFEKLSSKGLILLDDMIMINVNRGIKEWIELHEEEINYEYVVSLTGEMLIRRAGNHEKFLQTK